MVHMTDKETNQKAYINFTQVKELSEYNIIIPEQNKEKRK